MPNTTIKHRCGHDYDHTADRMASTRGGDDAEKIAYLASRDCPYCWASREDESAGLPPFQTADGHASRAMVAASILRRKVLAAFDGRILDVSFWLDNTEAILDIVNGAGASDGDVSRRRKAKKQRKAAKRREREDRQECRERPARGSARDLMEGIENMGRKQLLPDVEL